MPEPKLLKNFLQLGDGPKVDEEEVEAKVRLFKDMAVALDGGGGPSVETAVAFAALKLLAEKHLGFQIDVGVRSIEGKTEEQVRQELKDEFERTQRIAPPPPAGTTFH